MNARQMFPQRFEKTKDKHNGRIAKYRENIIKISSVPDREWNKRNRGINQRQISLSLYPNTAVQCPDMAITFIFDILHFVI